MDKFREECNNWNKLSDLIFELTKLVDSSREKEALDLRDRILNDIAKNYSEPLWNYLNLEEDLGCPLEVIEKAIKNGIYTNVYSGICYVTRSDDYLLVSDDYAVRLSDYKKTWWLKENREE